MSLSTHHSLRTGVRGPILLAILALTLVVQGSHFCGPAETSEAGVWAVVTVAATVCPVCALAYSAMIAVILILFSLVSSYSHILLLSVQVRSFWDGLRLDMRAPPAF